jgi:hypothetical protein
MKGRSIFSPVPLFALAVCLMSISGSELSGAQEPLRNSPFSYGEDIPDLVATCEDIRNWASKAPKTEMRISLAIRGELSRVHADSALVYLTMCADPNPKIMCVTYSRNGMSTGDVVTFAGGFRQADSERIILDPCLASRR